MLNAKSNQFNVKNATPTETSAKEIKFAADRMLGKLAKWLRIMGQDVIYGQHLSGYGLIHAARAENRLILTRDRGLKKKQPPDFLFIESDHYREQLRQVIKPAISSRWTMPLHAVWNATSSLSLGLRHRLKKSSRPTSSRPRKISPGVPNATAFTGRPRTIRRMLEELQRSRNLEFGQCRMLNRWVFSGSFSGLLLAESALLKPLTEKFKLLI